MPACCLRRPRRLSTTRGLFSHSNVTYGVEYSTLEMPVQGGSWYVVYSSHPLRGEKAPASKVSKVVELARLFALFDTAGSALRLNCSMPWEGALCGDHGGAVLCCGLTPTPT